MSVTKMEVSDKIGCLLVSDTQYGHTGFAILFGETDESLIAEYMQDDFGRYSRTFSYEEYKADADDWRTIYEKGE